MFFFFKQKTAYEMRISDWSSDVCSSDLVLQAHVLHGLGQVQRLGRIRRLGPAMGDVAERAAAGADLPQDHEGRGAVAEALVDVRARSEGRRVGKEWVSTCRSRWSTYP